MTDPNTPDHPSKSASGPQNGNKSFFITDSEPCPICTVESPRRHIKNSIYTEQGRDIDMRPLTIRWSDQNAIGLYPQLYFMRHCPACAYTAASKTFGTPTHATEIYEGKYIKLWKEAVARDNNDKKIIQYLKTGISTDTIDFIQAIKLQLLAIYQLQLIDQIAKKDSTDLGRYCLRLAWLLRDIRESDSLKKKFGAPITKLFKILAPKWGELPANEKTALQMAVDYFLTALEKSRTIETLMEEINLLLIIVRIYIKLKDFKNAHKFLIICTQKVRQHGSEAQALTKLEAEQERQKNQQKSGPNRKPEKTIDSAMVKQAVNESRKMKNMVDEVKRVYENCLDDHEKKQLKLGQDIIEKLKDRPVEEIEKILKQNKIENKIITKILQQEIDKPKSGIWSIFKK